MGQPNSKSRRKHQKICLEHQKQKLLQDVINVEQENQKILAKERKLQGKNDEETAGVADNSKNKNDRIVKHGKGYTIKDVSWPDPDPCVGNKSIRVDDVTRMNEENVNRIFFVRSVQDVQHVLNLAREDGRTVSIRGTKHSMGGQTIAKTGYVIDTARLNKIEYHIANKTVTVGSGILWSDVVYHLNAYGMSPRTLQSYSTFSVGGSLSVNAHGITSDYCLHESVVSFVDIKSLTGFLKFSESCVTASKISLSSRIPQIAPFLSSTAI